MAFPMSCPGQANPLGQTADEKKLARASQVDAVRG